MLRVQKSLLDPRQADESMKPELRPLAAAEIDVRKNHGTINVTLAGVILGASVSELRAFLQDVACFRATDWSLQLEALRVISAKGLRVLVQFARVLRSRGYRLKIEKVNPELYATLNELKLLHEFEWLD